MWDCVGVLCGKIGGVTVYVMKRVVFESNWGCDERTMATEAWEHTGG